MPTTPLSQINLFPNLVKLLGSHVALDQLAVPSPIPFYHPNVSSTLCEGKSDQSVAE